jgi:hypothetical protein
MSIFSLLIILAIVAGILWLVNSYIPISRKNKKIFNIVVVIIVILWLLSGLGAFGSQSNMHIGNMHMRW